MKLILLAALLLFSHFSFAQNLGSDYFEWKKCVKDSDCILVDAPPPCGCEPDAINTKYRKEYAKKFAELVQYWSSHPEKPNCEPCRKGLNKKTAIARCIKTCNVYPLATAK